jgi:hypothetical protein
VKQTQYLFQPDYEAIIGLDEISLSKNNRKDNLLGDPSLIIRLKLGYYNQFRTELRWEAVDGEFEVP